MPRILYLTAICLLAGIAAIAEGADPSIAFAVTANGQPVSQGQTVSGKVNITVTVTNGIAMHTAAYGNMILLPFNEPGHAPDTPVWSRTTQVDTRRFYDGENQLSVHVHPHNQAGEPYGADFNFATFTLISENANPAPNGDRLLPTLSFSSFGWTPSLGQEGDYYLSGDATMADDRTPGGVDRGFTTAAPIQMIAHLGESVLGRFRWNTLTPPFGDSGLVSRCHLRPFQRDQEFDARVVVFFTDGAGRANYATKAFRMPALTAADATALPLPLMDAKIVGLGNGGTLVVPEGGTAPLYVQLSNPQPAVWRYPEMTTWLGNRAVHVTSLLPLLETWPEGATSIIIEVPIPAAEIARMQAVRQGGEASTAMPVWLDFNQENEPNLPVSSHVHLNSVRTSGYSWPYGAPTVAIRKPWQGSGHWTGASLVAGYDRWGPWPSGSKVRWSLDGGAWTEDNGDGLIPLTGLTRQSHRLDVELVDSANVRLAGSGSFASATFMVVNAIPSAVTDTYVVSSGGSLTVGGSGVLANDADPDGDALSAIIASQARHGTVSLSATGAFTYTPTPGFIGFDRFSYRANDGAASSRETEVRIQVRASASGARLIGDWPMIGRDPQHTGHFPGFVGEVAPTLAWTASYSAGSSSVNRMRGAAVVGNRLVAAIDYYAYGQMLVSGFDTATGQRIWERGFEAGDATIPTIDQSTVFVANNTYSNGNRLQAMDLSTGAQRWTSSAQVTTGWPPTVANGMVWSGGSNRLYGYDAASGTQRFTYTALPTFDDWSPTYGNGVLFTWMQGTIRRHDATTGALQQQRQLVQTQSANGWMRTVPVLSGNKLVLRDDRRLIVCDANDLSVSWQAVPPLGNWKLTPVIHDGVVYAPRHMGMDVFDLASGRRLASIALPYAPLYGPIVTDDAVIVGCADSSYSKATCFLDRATLGIRFTLSQVGPLALAGNALYIADGDSNIQSPSIRKFAFTQVPTNSPPAAIGDVFTTSEDTALTITTASLLANDSDADGNPLTVRVTNQPANGTLTSISGGYRYMPSLDWYGTDSFTYVANDGQVDSQSATVTITVTAVDDPPAAFKPGLLAQFFDYTTALSVIPDLSGRTADVTRTDTQIAYTSVSTAWSGLPTTMADTFASRHTGWLKIDTAGSYTLFISSDDGSRVYLDGALLINNDGLHGMQERSATVTLNAGYHHLRVEFFESGGGAGLEFRWSGPGIAKQIVPASALWQEDSVAPPYVAGLLAEFFDFTTALSVIPDLTGRVPEASRTDAQIAYASVSTAWSGLPTTMVDTFASRHSGWLKIDTAGSYTLFISSDDGSRVFLDGAMVIDNDGLHGMQERSATLTLAAGYHPLRVEFFENGGGAGLQFSWSGPGIAKQLVPTSALWRLPAAVAGLPAPWTSTDIGAVGLAGSATGDGDDFTLLGGGADIWGNADAFQFVHRPLTTDGELIARVVSLGNTNAWAKAGVMVRASTAAGSVHGMMVLTPANGASFQYRSATGGTSGSAAVAGRAAPGWVRIVRSGSTLSGWVSDDGIAWTQVGTTISVPLGTTPVIGLAVTAHDNAVRTTAVFEQVVFVPAAGG